MAWAYQTVSSYGTSNANVARLVLQTKELAGITTLSQVDRDNLVAAAFRLALRMANAETAAQELQDRAQSSFDALKDDHRRGDAIELPYLQGLEILFEGFFYNAKNIVRDLGSLMKEVYGKSFSKASDWCAFGQRDSEVSRYLHRLSSERHPGFATVRNLVDNFRPNVELIVQTRNAVEHPGGASGTVIVQNFRPAGDGIAAPTFWFEDKEDKIYEIARTLADLHGGLLEMAETVIVFGLLHKFADPNLGIFRIAEADRDPKAPMAYRVIQVTDDMRKGSRPFNGRPE